MPKYLYFCSNCNEQFELIHPITTNIETCLKCGENTISRVYDSNFLIPKNIIEQKENKTGEEVKKFIKNAKEDLIEQKRELKNKGFER